MSRKRSCCAEDLLAIQVITQISGSLSPPLSLLVFSMKFFLLQISSLHPIHLLSETFAHNLIREILTNATIIGITVFQRIFSDVSALSLRPPSSLLTICQQRASCPEFLSPPMFLSDFLWKSSSMFNSVFSSAIFLQCCGNSFPCSLLQLLQCLSFFTYSTVARISFFTSSTASTLRWSSLCETSSTSSEIWDSHAATPPR